MKRLKVAGLFSVIPTSDLERLQSHAIMIQSLLGQLQPLLGHSYDIGSIYVELVGETHVLSEGLQSFFTQADRFE